MVTISDEGKGKWGPFLITVTTDYPDTMVLPWELVETIYQFRTIVQSNSHILKINQLQLKIYMAPELRKESVLKGPKSFFNQ